MPELVLLTLTREQFLPLHRAAEAGDAEAAQQIAAFWDDYSETILECFICGGIAADPTTWPPHCLVMPDHDGINLISLPLCVSCWELPKPKRWNRALTLLRKMWSARFGKNIHFQSTANKRRRHP